MTILTQDATITGQARPGAPLRRGDAEVLGGGEGRSGRGDRRADEGEAGPRIASSHKTSWSPTCRTSRRPATEGKPIGWGALSDWEATEKLLKQYRDLETDKPATAFFTNEFLPQ